MFLNSGVPSPIATGSSIIWYTSIKPSSVNWLIILPLPNMVISFPSICFIFFISSTISPFTSRVLFQSAFSRVLEKTILSAAAWPSRNDEMGFADRMNSLPKFVVSSTLEKLNWSNSTLIKEDIIERIRELKEQSGEDILIIGSGRLAQTLMAHDLIDEYRLMIHPTILGTGRQLYNNIGARKKLRLIEAKTFRTGVVVLVYHPVS